MFNFVDQLSLMDESDLQSELLVHHWMTQPHFLIFENQTIEEIIEMMRLKGTDLILINREHHVLGLLTNKTIYELLHQGHSLNRPIEESSIEKVTPVFEDTSVLHIGLPKTVIPVVNHEQHIIGSVGHEELLMAHQFLSQSIQHNVNVVDIILDIAYEGVTLVDRNGFILKMNKAYRTFLDITFEEVVGKHVTDVIDNTHLHLTAKSGIPERGKIQWIKGQKMVVHRIPIWQNNELIGAIGMLTFEGVSELYRILENATRSSSKNNSKQVRTEELIQIERNSSRTFDHILGVSQELLACKRISKKAAKTKATVLITGESGTGKEVFAQAIHHSSLRASGPFVALNCAAIPEHLLEAELFGYEEGAFTGAKKGGSKGKFEMANEGTIFLDEIGDMPKQMQTKILRVLEEREVMKVGGSKNIPINVRVMAATNQELLDRVRDGSFREDLYYRLNVIHIDIPPLRRRREDIPILFSHYLKKFCEDYQMNEKGIEPDVMEIIRSYEWPGNIRQLVNTTEHLITLVDGDLIKTHHLPKTIKDQQIRTMKDQSLKSERSEHEKEAIQRTLLEVKGNKTKAANRLGIHRTTIYKKMKQYGLDV